MAAERLGGQEGIAQKRGEPMDKGLLERRLVEDLQVERSQRRVVVEPLLGLGAQPVPDRIVFERIHFLLHRYGGTERLGGHRKLPIRFLVRSGGAQNRGRRWQVGENVPPACRCQNADQQTYCAMCEIFSNLSHTVRIGSTNMENYFNAL